MHATIAAQPEAYAAIHFAKTCRRCWSQRGERTKYWLGYYERFSGNKKWQARRWACMWRVRLYSHRVSFIGEGNLFNALQSEPLPSHLDDMLLNAFCSVAGLAEACEAGAEVLHSLISNVLNSSTEDLLASVKQWHGALMKDMRLRAWYCCGRRDVLAIDGNAKLYRRTCGAPCAQTVYVPSLDSPQQQGVLSPAHAAFRSQQQLSGDCGSSGG